MSYVRIRNCMDRMLNFQVYKYIYYDDVIFQRSRLVFIFAYTCAWQIWYIRMYIYTHLGAGWYIYTHAGFSLPYMNSKVYK